MGYKKYEVLVRKISKTDIDDVIKIFKKAINTKQESDPDTYWAAGIFDLRTLKEFIIFSDKAAEIFSIDDEYVTKHYEKIPGVMFLGQRITDRIPDEIMDKIIEELKARGVV